MSMRYKGGIRAEQRLYDIRGYNQSPKPRHVVKISLLCYDEVCRLWYPYDLPHHVTTVRAGDESPSQIVRGWNVVALYRMSSIAMTTHIMC